MRQLVNVDWQITSMCNRKCPYCFGPKGIDTLPLSVICNVIDVLKSNGTKQIGITGGEPLLHPHFSDIIEYLYESGIRIYLSTNCDYYEQYSSLIKSKVSIVGIPVDGSNPEIHDYHRGKSSFQAVLHAINDISRSNCLAKIKIGTVVTQMNWSNLIEIEKLLAEYGDKIIYWKLYHLIAYKRNQKQIDQLKPSDKKRDCLGTFLGTAKIVDDTLEKRDRSYFFIKPNGDVFIPILAERFSKEEIIGNIVTDDIDSLQCTFNSLVDYKGYTSPIRYMCT